MNHKETPCQRRITGPVGNDTFHVPHCYSEFVCPTNSMNLIGATSSDLVTQATPSLLISVL